MTSTITGDRSPGRYWLDIAVDTSNAHDMIGAAVTGLLAVLVDKDEAEGRTEAANDDYLELRREYDDIEAHCGRLQQVIDDILAAVKPSTAKLSNRVREIVDEAFKVPPVAPPAGEPTVGDQVNDAAAAGAQGGTAGGSE